MTDRTSTPATSDDDALAGAALERAWHDPPTLKGWICTLDHKALGRRFVVTALLFFFAGGVLGGLMRHQLSRPENRMLGPDAFNQVFSMHGTTMMFLFAVPVMQGVALYLVPLMIGTRNTAFARMSSCAYWVYLTGGLTLFAGFACNTGADAGWFAYVPLAGPEYGFGKRSDFWNVLVNFTEAMGLMVAVDLATTSLKMRAPGMSLLRMPLFVGFACNTGADAGWFAYVPLAGPEYGFGKRPDFWNVLVNFTEAMGLMVAVDLATTALKMRAPGMSLQRMPLFVWATLVSSIMIIFAMPTVMLGANLVQFDRMAGTHFFNAAEGGDPLLWQHVFWYFGHPEVYFIFVPALGFVSAIIPTFARRPMFGHTAIVLSLISTGFLSFGLWVHHMYATNVPELGKSFFTAMSFMIAIPSAVQLFCWIATLWCGRTQLKSPLLFVVGFFVTLVIGGLTGIMLGSVPLDLQVHDTQFVVAHLHYVLIGGALFPLFGAIYYWFPKIYGRVLNESLAKWHFWLLFVGFNLTFFPLHVLGLAGMPRRVWTYTADTGWGPLQFVSWIGAMIDDLGMFVFIFNVAWTLWKGRKAPDNPWGAGTLEWATPSPPAPYNFVRLPIVASREPLWSPPTHGPHQVIGLSTRHREGLVTTVLDALPDVRYCYPEPSIWPVAAALGVGFWLIWSIFSNKGMLIGMIPPAIAFVAWYWPDKKESDAELELEKRP